MAIDGGAVNLKHLSSMDLKAIRKRLRAGRVSPHEVFRAAGFKRTGAGFIRAFGAVLVILPLLAVVSFVCRSPHSDRTPPKARVSPLVIVSDDSAGSQNNTIQQNVSTTTNLLDGLLAPGFNQGSCFSRYKSRSYRKPSPYEPSPYLLSKLRSYEDRHRRCGPNTKPYNSALKLLKTQGNASSTSTPSNCNYIVWISFSGLGNRILTLASAFLYALLTDRVLLVDPGSGMADLFCEPFPNTSWFLPSDFPLKSKFSGFGKDSPQCHGQMLKNNQLNQTVPSYVYLHLIHDYDDHDKLFFCDEEQNVLKKVQWLFMRSDNYFVPALFLMSSFEEGLSRLFPRKAAVFHHIGRYLFHPTNEVWGLITRFYDAYMSKANERIGVQIRVFEPSETALQHVKDQILNCALTHKLLPQIHTNETIDISSQGSKSKSVLVTSLKLGYYETLKELYWEHATVTGETLSFFQPSHEEFQRSDETSHDRKAWAEMYLLSLTDKLVTSAWSTFGYVAQGLGGLKPWILYRAENQTAPDPPCVRAMSIEPCFHAPLFWDCKAKRGADTGAIVPHVRHCEDVSWGLKLVDKNEEM